LRPRAYIKLTDGLQFFGGGTVADRCNWQHPAANFPGPTGVTTPLRSALHRT
jgi:hypothetical protein